MKYCWAPNCKETDKNKTILFHLFPKIFYERELWIKATDRLDKPGKTAVLCSKHFRPTDFDRTTKKAKLKHDIIPSHFKNILEARPNDLANQTASIADSTPLLPMHLEDVEDNINKSHPDNVHNIQSLLSKRIIGSQSKKAIKWQPKHVTQVTPEHLLSSSNRIKYWSKAIQEITMLRKKVKLLQEHNRRLVKRIKNFKSLMVHVDKKGLLSKNALDTLTVYIF